MKIITIIGARPQFIKAAVVSRAFAKHPEIQEIIIHTGQHYDANMSDVFFEEMKIPNPHYNLSIHGMSHGAMTGQMIEQIEALLVKEQPDWVLLYGDTTSTLSGALAAKKLHIPVAHIEGGLRNHDMSIPEEINRIITDRISDVIFCPTDLALQNLIKEGFDSFPCQIIRTGDVMYDAALFYRSFMKPLKVDIPDRFVLCTCHRASNTDNIEALHRIMKALEDISRTCTVVFPIHPRTKAKLIQEKYTFENSKICFIDPVGYFEMSWLLENCELVVTDSGGVQKEASFFNKYGILLLEYTPWEELVDAGYSFLAKDDDKKIVSLFHALYEKHYDDRGQLYGDGNSAKIICQYFLSKNLNT